MLSLQSEFHTCIKQKNYNDFLLNCLHLCFNVTWLFLTLLLATRVIPMIATFSLKDVVPEPVPNTPASVTPSPSIEIPL